MTWSVNKMATFMSYTMQNVSPGKVRHKPTHQICDGFTVPFMTESSFLIILMYVCGSLYSLSDSWDWTLLTSYFIKELRN